MCAGVEGERQGLAWAALSKRDLLWGFFPGFFPGQPGSPSSAVCGCALYRQGGECLKPVAFACEVKRLMEVAALADVTSGVCCCSDTATGVSVLE